MKLINRQTPRLEQKRKRQQERADPSQLKNPIKKEFNRKISKWARKELSKQLEKAEEAARKSIDPIHFKTLYTVIYSRYLGVPCAHTPYDYVLAGPSPSEYLINTHNLPKRDLVSLLSHDISASVSLY